ncbi:MAG: hypothetical protein AB1716_10185 [Planctomycetota bacterium]
MRAPDRAAAKTTPSEQSLAFRVLRFDRVDPDRQLVYKLAHIQPERAAHARWVELVEQLVVQLQPVMRPRGIFRIDPVMALEPRRIVLGSGAIFEGAVGAFLKHATMMATYVVTIGSAVERLSRGWLRQGKVMQGAIADAIASQSVEAAGDLLATEVRQWARARGCEITPPYSPGYCGMTVQQQVPLFTSLPTRLINVRRTASCLMVPVKSISGLIGIGPADKVSPGGYPCEACTHPDCMQRRAPLNRALMNGIDLGPEALPMR